MYQEVLKSTRTQLVLEHVLTGKDLPSYTSAARLQMLRPASARRQLILDRARHVARAPSSLGSCMNARV
jgi:hypothetical protein